jgi:hypothetical protein
MQYKKYMHYTIFHELHAVAIMEVLFYACAITCALHNFTGIYRTQGF